MKPFNFEAAKADFDVIFYPDTIHKLGSGTWHIENKDGVSFNLDEKKDILQLTNFINFLLTK